LDEKAYSNNDIVAVGILQTDLTWYW